MKAVILAGGLGTRFTEETTLKPKPMVEIGGKPILWHIMKIYSTHGINDFIICCGYKGYMIKEYFNNYFLHTADVTFDLASHKMKILQQHSEPWKVTVVDTGEATMTGGRLKRVAPYLKGEKDFCFTYGDGLSSINITKLVEFHRSQKTLATLTAVQPPGRYGALEINDNKVTSFKEKPRGDGAWINGGFFVLRPEVLKFIKNDQTIWEAEPMERLAGKGQLSVYKHKGFWQAMDKLYDKNLLENLWQKKSPPWKVWK